MEEGSDPEKKGAARPKCQPSSWPVALKSEKSGHSVSLDPADLKRFLRWTLEGTLLPQPFSLISEITVVFPACVEAAWSEVWGGLVGGAIRWHGVQVWLSTGHVLH